jgi:hypothetical protein
MHDYGLKIDSEEDRDSKVRKDQMQNAFEDIEKHHAEFEMMGKTEKNAIIKSRLGQGRFRKEVIKEWRSGQLQAFAIRLT